MSHPIKIHHPHATTHLPAHEHTARRQRAAALHLPGIPGTRPPRKSTPTIPAGRKTTHVERPNLPSSLRHRSTH